MEPIFLFAIVAIIVVLVAVSAFGGSNATDKKATTAAPSTYPYRLAGPLFTPAERSFLGTLELVVDDEHRVFGKVRVADIIKVNKMSDRKAWGAAFARIKAKHFDFVVARRSDLSVVCVIELDDKSHGSQKAQARDVFVDGTCNAASLPIVRIPARAAYSRKEIKAALDAVLEPDVSGISNDRHDEAALASSESIATKGAQ